MFYTSIYGNVKYVSESLQAILIHVTHRWAWFEQQDIIEVTTELYNKEEEKADERSKEDATNG